MLGVNTGAMSPSVSCSSVNPAGEVTVKQDRRDRLQTPFHRNAEAPLSPTQLLCAPLVSHSPCGIAVTPVQPEGSTEDSSVEMSCLGRLWVRSRVGKLIPEIIQPQSSLSRCCPAQPCSLPCTKTSLCLTFPVFHPPPGVAWGISNALSQQEAAPGAVDVGLVVDPHCRVGFETPQCSRHARVVVSP